MCKQVKLHTYNFANVFTNKFHPSIVSDDPPRLLRVQPHSLSYVIPIYYAHVQAHMYVNMEHTMFWNRSYMYVGDQVSSLHFFSQKPCKFCIIL